MADSTDVLDIIHTTRTMRRLRPDPVPDALIRKILDAVEVRDLLIEDEPIEEIIKRIYAGEVQLEIPV